MKTGKYNILDLFNNRYIEQIIIPEIQRDYVWGKEQVTGLLTSILNDFERYSAASVMLPDSVDEELREDFNEYYKGRIHASNIGFIYAYTDHEYAGKYFLIDGQQRITTIYLVILALMYRNSLEKEFADLYISNNRLKLDYRVRETAHEFMGNFVNAVLAGEADIKNKVWFHRQYLNDQTIRSVIENYETIGEFLGSYGADELQLLEYIQEYVEFWYFDTNISEQGEELYIYMNARGEQMQSNENLKADLLLPQPKHQKNFYGELWERWQDFFWQNRGNNDNADKGFNEFLKCIAGLENYLSDRNIFYTSDEFTKKGRGSEKDIAYADLKSALSFPVIEKYIEAFRYLIDNRKEFASKYSYNAWLDKSMATLWSVFNGDPTNWFADYNDQDRGLERQKMVFAWSVLHYIVTSKNKDTDEVFRVLRFYYLRYHNYNRSVPTMRKKIREIQLDGVWGKEEILTEPENDESAENYNEEKQKGAWLRSLSGDEIRTFEELIWEIEDHPYNLPGRDLKNINSSHLINFKKRTSVRTLTNIKENFYRLFPIKEDFNRLKTLQTILLFYGSYWQMQSPTYYDNLGFDNWHRIVRDMDGDGKTFKLFFSDWMKYPDATLNEWMDEVTVPEQTPLEEMTLHQQLKWYAAHLKLRMWDKGGNIALRHWVMCDKVFKKQPKFINTKGTVRGYDHNELADLLPKEVLKEIRNKAKQ